MELGYQPVVTCADGALVGVEALLRWTTGDEPVAPAAIVAFAERTGLIRRLGSWVLDAGCGEAARWRREHPGVALRLDVSLSTYQLRSPLFVREVHETLERTGLAPDELVLHVSGTVLAQESELAHSVLTRLREVGVRVALDDFGGGCCSLDQLQELPLDLVRIDFAVVDAQGRGDALLPPLVDLAHVLDLTVLVDGVVSESQRDVAVAAGADLAQGAWFARAMSVPAIDLLLDGRASDAAGRILMPLGG